MRKTGKQHYTVKKGVTVILLMLVAVIIISLISMNLGRMNLTPAEVFRVILGKGTDKQNLIVFGFRLTEITLSVLVGIGMGASGCIMQSLLRNDMASPGTLGISSGSGLFVLIFIVLYSANAQASAISMPLLAFVGGIIAAVLIFVLSYRRGREISSTGLILTGVALGSGYGAVTMLLILRLNEWQMDFFQRWNAGSLWGVEWKYIIILVPWTFILLAYVFYKAKILNAIHLGNQTATGLGVAIKPEFLGLSLAAIALASGCVALGGNFFFVGMIAPHMAKKLVGSNHKLLLPAASLAGAIIVLLGDTITRTISLGADIPAGIIITVISTPYFLYLLAKSD